jgi:hypothetical protein
MLLGFAGIATCGLWWLTTDLVAAADRGGTTFDETLGIAALVGCWLCVGWFVLAVGCAGLAAAPGLVGRCGTSCAQLVAPWALRRLVATGLGLAVVTGSGAAVAEASVLESLPRAEVVASTVDQRLLLAGLGSDLPPLDRPADDTYIVTVRSGDCLWSIAARHLGPQASDAEIASTWPRWYATNRSVIGPDPNLLQPGQVLIVPS